jgi:uncharacterized membrane protein
MLKIIVAVAVLMALAIAWYFLPWGYYGMHGGG